jgi:hypothetical protein
MVAILHRKGIASWKLKLHVALPRWVKLQWKFITSNYSSITSNYIFSHSTHFDVFSQLYILIHYSFAQICT